MAGGGDSVNRVGLTASTAGMCSVTGCGAGCGGDDTGISGSVWICYGILDFPKATALARIQITAVGAARTGNCFNKYIGMIQRSISE